MAENKKVFDVETIELQDGNTLEIKPLVIKKYKQGIKKWRAGMETARQNAANQLKAAEEAEKKGEPIPPANFDEDPILDCMVEMCAIAMDKPGSAWEGASSNVAIIEDVLDQKSMYRIIKIAYDIDLEEIEGKVQEAAMEMETDI